MPIETICKGCSRKLRVGDEHAGKKARCPQCGSLYTVPGSPQATSHSSSGSFRSDSESPPSSSPSGWRLRTPDDRIYGPVPKEELDQWVREGRVTINCQLSRPGMESWAPADQVYPELAPQQNQAASQNPFSDAADASSNPFAVTGSSTPTTTYQQPHRGGLILTLAILGWALCVVFAPFAWSMGSNDLKAMRSGHMDPRGMGLTQAGMILGMVQSILLLIGIAIYLIFMVIIVIAHA